MPIATGPTISCGFASVPVAVIATYAGRRIPIQGANVTVYLGAALPGLSMTTVPVGFTDQNGLAQTCITAFRYNEAWVQKGDVDFGDGVGKRHKIGSNPGGAGSLTYYIEARTPPPPPTCTPPQVYNPGTGQCEAPPCSGLLTASVPDFQSILSGSTLPSNIPLQVTSTVGGALQNIPISILVDGREVLTSVSNRSIDIFSIIRSIGPASVNASHTVTIRSNQPNCNIPPFTFNIPPLVPSLPTCTPPKVLNPITRQCESPAIPTCAPPQVYNPITGRCETPTPTCTPPQVYNPVTGRCETPSALTLPPVTEVPSLPGKSVHIETIPSAYPTQQVPIIATVLCGAKPSNGEFATFYIDGEVVDRKLTSNGLVQFSWMAEAGTHRVIVDVPASDFCNRPGRDATDINVSAAKPAILEQLTRERQAFEQQQTALEQQRRLIRELPLPSTVTVPTTPTVPALTSVTIPAISAPAGTTVSIAGQTVTASPTTPVTIQVPPGQYTVVVQPPTGSPVSAPVQIPSSPIPVPITLPSLPVLSGV